MVSCMSRCQETFSVFIYGERVYALTSFKYIFNFYDLGINSLNTFFCISEFFVDPTHEL